MRRMWRGRIANPANTQPEFSGLAGTTTSWQAYDPACGTGGMLALTKELLVATETLGSG